MIRIGDRVQVNENYKASMYYGTGKIGTVTNVKQGSGVRCSVSVKWDCGEEWKDMYQPDCLDVIKPIFQLGDKVEFLCSCHKGWAGVVDMMRTDNTGTAKLDKTGESISITTDNARRLDSPLIFGKAALDFFEGKSGHPMFYKLLRRMGGTHDVKNKDYARGGDPVGNFKRVSAIKKLYPNIDWSTATATAIDYMLKQLDCALWMLDQKFEGDVEGYEKRMIDVANYSLLSVINKKEEGI